MSLIEILTANNSHIVRQISGKYKLGLVLFLILMVPTEFHKIIFIAHFRADSRSLALQMNYSGSTLFPYDLWK
jgi:hypothetical protein